MGLSPTGKSASIAAQARPSVCANCIGARPAGDSFRRQGVELTSVGRGQLENWRYTAKVWSGSGWRTPNSSKVFWMRCSMPCGRRPKSKLNQFPCEKLTEKRKKSCAQFRLSRNSSGVPELPGLGTQSSGSPDFRTHNFRARLIFSTRASPWLPHPPCPWPKPTASPASDD